MTKREQSSPFPLPAATQEPRGRVRAILITPAGTMLVIRRVRPGVTPYWVLPGGAVEPEDPTLEAALAREIREEVAGVARSERLVRILGTGAERSYYYIAEIRQWSFADRSGPEFNVPGSGEYYLEEIPVSADALDRINLKPDDLATWLRDVVAAGDLLRLPDLRS